MERDEREAAAERAELLSLRARVAELEAIIAGRTTPPTDAEIEAHAKTGGLWRMIDALDYKRSRDEMGGAEALALASAASKHCTWWALSSNRRPTAWPVAEVPRG